MSDLKKREIVHFVLSGKKEYSGLIRMLNASLEVTSTPSVSSKENAINQAIKHIYASSVDTEAKPTNFTKFLSEMRSKQTRFPRVYASNVEQIRGWLLDTSPRQRPFLNKEKFNEWSIADFINLLDKLGEKIIEIIPLVLPDYIRPDNLRRLVERIVEYDQYKLDKFLILWRIYTGEMELDSEKDNKKIVDDLAMVVDRAGKTDETFSRGGKMSALAINRILEIDISSATGCVENGQVIADENMDIVENVDILTNNVKHSIFIIQENNNSAVVKKLGSETSDNKTQAISEKARKDELIKGLSEQELRELIENRSKLEIVADTPDEELQNFVNTYRQYEEQIIKGDVRVISPMAFNNDRNEILTEAQKGAKYIVERKGERLAVLSSYVSRESGEDKNLSQEDQDKLRTIVDESAKDLPMKLKKASMIEGFSLEDLEKIVALLKGKFNILDVLSKL